MTTTAPKQHIIDNLAEIQELARTVHTLLDAIWMDPLMPSEVATAENEARMLLKRLDRLESDLLEDS